MINNGQIFTSFGDMSRLGILEAFRPSSGHETLIVDELDFTIRSTLPGTEFVLYQYDGRFCIRTSNGRRFMSVEDVELQCRIVKDLFSALV